MKIVWILLISLFIVFLLDDAECWRRRRFRIRIRVRRVTRKVLPRIRGRKLIRNILPRIRGRKLIRNIGNVVKNGVKAVAHVAILTNPELFLAKSIYDQYRRNKIVKEIAEAAGSAPPQCVGTEICGGACNGERCRWHCANTCDVVADDQLINWPGQIVTVPCRFDEYDYDGLGYFEPADLAWHMNQRGRERDNMMVFNKLDQNGDGRVTPAEFAITKDILLKDEENCEI